MSAYQRLEGDALQTLATAGIDPAVVECVTTDPVGWGLEEYAAEVGSSRDVALALLGCAHGWLEDALEDLLGPGDPERETLAPLVPLLRAATSEWFSRAERQVVGGAQ